MEKGAHFYRSLQIDAHGNPINKRNAWATRAVVYVRLIPPGRGRHGALPHTYPGKRRKQNHAARPPLLPESSPGVTRTRHSRVCLFQPGRTQVSADYDDRPTVFTASLSGVSAKKKKIPIYPLFPWLKMK